MSNVGITKYTEQYIQNMSFDDGLKVLMVEIIGQDGVLKNPATEETLQAVAGMNYDTTSVDLSDMSNVVITYKLLGTTIAIETITKTGSIYNIVKS